MIRIASLAGIVILLAACGGGSSASSTNAATGSTALRLVEERHANGQLAAQGTVLDVGGRAVRQGRWRTWFENGRLRWEGDYRRDVIDNTRPWREWNADGSVRDDSGDGDG